MDGQERERRSRGGSSPRSSGSSRGPGARDAAASGSAELTRTTAISLAGNRRPRRGVQATYRLLQIRGLEATEAANLTAWLTGIPVREHHWDIREINALLFLRGLTRLGRFGPTDGRPN